VVFTASLTISVAPSDRPYDTAAQCDTGHKCRANLSKNTRELHIDLLGDQGDRLNDQRVLVSSVDAWSVELSKTTLAMLTNGNSKSVRSPDLNYFR